MSAAIETEGAVQVVLGYAERGWRVLPVHHIREDGFCSCTAPDGAHRGKRWNGKDKAWTPCESQGKHPRESAWQKRASTDVTQIQAWARKWPGTNWGIATGPESGLFPLDVDPDNGGFDTLTALEAEHGALPATRQHITGSGGMHYLFAYPARERKDGRPWRNSAGKLGPGLDTRGAGGQIVAPPSVSAKGEYTLVDLDTAVVAPPEWLLDLLEARKETQRTKQAAVTLPVMTGDRLIDYVARAVAGECDKVEHAPNGTQNNQIHESAMKLGGLVLADWAALTEAEVFAALEAAAQRGGHPAHRATGAIRSGLDDAKPRPVPVERITGRRVTVEDVRGYIAEGFDVDDLRLALSAQQWEALGVDELLAEAGRPIANSTHEPVAAPVITDLMGEFMASLRRWMHVPDAAPTLVTLGVAVTAVEKNSDVQPVWLQNVGASSSGKTENVHLLKDIQVGNLSEVTEAGLLSWTKGKNAKATGLLAHIRFGLVTFGDFSTVLAGADRGGRDKLFAALRRVYDGEYTRDVAPPGKTDDSSLSWSGRLTIISAVTNDIDRQLAFAQSLGERWLYVRVGEPTREEQRASARRARRRDTGDRSMSVELATKLIKQGQARYPRVECSDDLLDEIDILAQVAAWGRASVPRASYGDRAILDVATVEGLGRITQQLGTLARGLLALGLSEADTVTLCRRVALDSMPLKRRKVLAALAKAEDAMTAGVVARIAGVDRMVARHVCEDMEAVGVVTGIGGKEEDEEFGQGGVSVRDSREMSGWRRWRLSGLDGEDVRRVFTAPQKIGI